MPAESFTLEELELLRVFIAVGHGTIDTANDTREEITKAYDVFTRLVSRVDASRAVAAMQSPKPSPSVCPRPT